MKNILKGLPADKLKQEQALRKKVLEELKSYRQSRFELGRLLTQLHDDIVGDKKFKQYVGALGIARRSAYRWMDSYQALSKLPKSIVVAAEKRKLDLALGKYLAPVQEIPLPQNPTPSAANQWLDSVEARRHEIKGGHSKNSNSPVLTAEERVEVTSREYLRHCRQLLAFTEEHWGEVPAEERALEVVQSLMATVASHLGVTRSFTVIPSPADSNRLLERLEKLTTAEEKVEEEVAAA